MSGRRYAAHGYRRRNKKTDENEREIIDALEAAGATVVPIGKPVDLLCGFQNSTYLLEVKNPNGKNRIEPSQAEFMDEWRGHPVAVVRTIDEALNAIGAHAGALQVARIPR